MSPERARELLDRVFALRAEQPSPLARAVLWRLRHWPLTGLVGMAWRACTSPRTMLAVLSGCDALWRRAFAAWARSDRAHFRCASDPCAHCASAIRAAVPTVTLGELLA